MHTTHVNGSLTNNREYNVALRSRRNRRVGSRILLGPPGIFIGLTLLVLITPIVLNSYWVKSKHLEDKSVTHELKHEDLLKKTTVKQRHSWLYNRAPRYIPASDIPRPEQQNTVGIGDVIF